MERAPHVCQTCMSRKKACDKALPSCSFCARRQLNCVYGPQKLNKPRNHHPGRHFVQLHSSPPLPSALLREPELALGSWNKAIARPLVIHNLTPEQIVDSYVKSFHRSVPVISPAQFSAEDFELLNNYETSPQRAELTSLILSLSLIVLPSCSQYDGQSHLYLSAKSIFALAQTQMSASLRLLQAAFLIALREYTCVRLEAAYTSVMACWGISRILGTNNNTSKENSAHCGNDCRPISWEERNLAWAVPMLERLVICEMDRCRTLRPQTEIPKGNIVLPPLVPNLSAADIEQFARQTQALRLIDEFLSVSSAADPQEAQLLRLEELGKKATELLSVVMADLEGSPTLCSVPTALLARLLFLVHESILDIHQQAADDHSGGTERSYIALDVATRMMLDILRRHEEEPTPPMPICCIFNLRAAQKNLQKRQSLQLSGQEQAGLTQDIKAVLQSEGKYRSMWMF